MLEGLLRSIHSSYPSSTVSAVGNFGVVDEPQFGLWWFYCTCNCLIFKINRLNGFRISEI